MPLKERVEKLERKVDNHESRISSMEKKFDFIKNTLVSIKETMPKKIKFSMKNLSVWKVLLILVIVFILVGATVGNA